MTNANPWDSIRSETLDFLRMLEYAKQFVGPIAQFVVVVDANVVLNELSWLAKRHNSTASPSIMECIRAGTFVAYISSSARDEVEEHIPDRAKKAGVPPEALLVEWEQYRKLLEVQTPEKSLVEKYAGGQDPDDAPHLALADQVLADGILSNDSDVVAMGGLALEVEFVIDAKTYSRKMAVAISIKTLGITSAIVAVSAIKIAGDIFVEATRSFAKLPPPCRLLILIAIVLLASNESVQDAVKKAFSRIRDALVGKAPSAIDFISKAAEAYGKNMTAPPHLKYRF